MVLPDELHTGEEKSVFLPRVTWARSATGAADITEQC